MSRRYGSTSASTTAGGGGGLHSPSRSSSSHPADAILRRTAEYSKGHRRIYGLVKEASQLLGDLGKLSTDCSGLTQVLSDALLLNARSEDALAACLKCLEEAREAQQGAGGGAEQELRDGHVRDGEFVRAVRGNYGALLDKALADARKNGGEKGGGSGAMQSDIVRSLLTALGHAKDAKQKGGGGKKRKGGDSDSDSDIEIETNDANVSSSFLCVITRAQFDGKENMPMKSSVCNHVVSKAGLGMITRNSKFYCPFAGCSNNKNKRYTEDAWRAQWKEDDETLFNLESWNKKRERMEERKRKKMGSDDEDDDDDGEEAEVL